MYMYMYMYMYVVNYFIHITHARTMHTHTHAGADTCGFGDEELDMHIYISSHAVILCCLSIAAFRTFGVSSQIAHHAN